RSGAAAAGIPSDPRALTDWAARTAPWRSYFTAHLWRAAAPKRSAELHGSRAPRPRRTPEPRSTRPNGGVLQTLSEETP
ncbi:MAG: DNA-3-methyladenine glycosylase, partial [Microbacterium sp.]